MSLILIVVVVFLLLNCSVLRQVPWNAIGRGVDLLRGWDFNNRYDEFQRGVQRNNRYARETAERLGPIYNTTSAAGDLYHGARTMAADQYGRATGLAANQYGTARGLASGLSDQATRDVNRRFDQLGAAGQAGLAARGIGGSTVGPSVAYANERNRSDELRRVNDERIQALLGVEETFGGRAIDTLATFGGRQIDTEATFGQEAIRASEAAAEARLRALQGGTMIAPSPPSPFIPSGRGFERL